MPSLHLCRVNGFLVSFSQHCFSLFREASVDLTCPTHTHTHTLTHTHTHTHTHTCTESALQIPGGQDNPTPFASSCRTWRAEGQTHGRHSNIFIWSTQDGLSRSCVVTPVSAQVGYGLKRNVMDGPGNSSHYFRTCVLLAGSLWHQSLDSGPSKGCDKGAVARIWAEPEQEPSVWMSGCARAEGGWTQVLESRRWHPGWLWTPHPWAGIQPHGDTGSPETMQDAQLNSNFS